MKHEKWIVLIQNILKSFKNLMMTLNYYNSKIKLHETGNIKHCKDLEHIWLWIFTKKIRLEMVN